MTIVCKSIGCPEAAIFQQDFCESCVSRTEESAGEQPGASLSKRYPKYYKSVGDLTEIDVYAVHHLFQINDSSGALQHASKKILLHGVRTGGKSPFKDIKEARDALTRWMELNEDAAA
jgi:hypothetical protein